MTGKPGTQSFFVRPAAHVSKGQKPRIRPAAGRRQPKARASAARRNLKEAGCHGANGLGSGNTDRIWKNPYKAKNTNRTGRAKAGGFRQQPPGLYKPTSSGELIVAYYDGETVKAFYTQQGKGDLESVWYFCLAPDGGLGYIRANNLQEVIPVV